MRGEGRGLSWPRVAFATCKTCPTCVQHMQQLQLQLQQLLPEPAANSRFLDNVVLYVSPACLPAYVCMRVCMLTISCAVNVFLLYLQHSARSTQRPCPRLTHLTPTSCVTSKSTDAQFAFANVAVVRRSLQAAFPWPSPAPPLCPAFSLPLDRQKRVSCLYACYVCGMF